jgi:hypothetical protein
VIIDSNHTGMQDRNSSFEVFVTWNRVPPEPAFRGTKIGFWRDKGRQHNGESPHGSAQQNCWQSGGNASEDGACLLSLARLRIGAGEAVIQASLEQVAALLLRPGAFLCWESFGEFLLARENNGFFLCPVMLNGNDPSHHPVSPHLDQQMTLKHLLFWLQSKQRGKVVGGSGACPARGAGMSSHCHPGRPRSHASHHNAR